MQLDSRYQSPDVSCCLFYFCRGLEGFVRQRLRAHAESSSTAVGMLTQHFEYQRRAPFIR